jgi:hypothetical protein
LIKRKNPKDFRKKDLKTKPKIDFECKKENKMSIKLLCTSNKEILETCLEFLIKDDNK